MLIFTIAATNYLPKAVILAESVKRWLPNAKVALILLEKGMHPSLDTCALFDFTLLARDLNIDSFDAFVFRHSLVEAATAIKARCFLDLMALFPEESDFLYLDPDIWVFSSFDELPAAFNRHPIVVTPHLLEDEATEEGVRDNVLRVLQCGIFNFGFLAIRRGAEAADFLKWWHSRLEMMCYMEIDKGLYLDQRWFDLAASFFDYEVLREPGYNVANWNISSRPIRQDANGAFLVNGKPLRFLHFSGIDIGKDMRFLAKYGGGHDAPIHQLRQRYKELMQENGRQSLGNSVWTYDYFDSGEMVAVQARLACRRNKELLRAYPNPFKESNEAFLSHNG